MNPLAVTCVAVLAWLLFCGWLIFRVIRGPRRSKPERSPFTAEQSREIDRRIDDAVRFLRVSGYLREVER
jgi:hypothetical protein